MNEVTDVNRQRRTFLRTTAGAGLIAAAAAAGLLKPARALAAGWDKAAFEAKGVPEALKALGAAAAEPSKQVVIKAPDAAENGAVVPVEVTSQLPNTEAILVFAEKNTTPLVANFELANGAEPYVATRIKMIQSSAVRAVVRAGGKYYSASKDIRVTIGGCGG